MFHSPHILAREFHEVRAVIRCLQLIGRRKSKRLHPMDKLTRRGIKVADQLLAAQMKCNYILQSHSEVLLVANTPGSAENLEVPEANEYFKSFCDRLLNP